MSSRKPPTTVAGLEGIAKAAAAGAREMGVSRMLRGWLAINQHRGFDCPSCAWADPDGPRHTAEFCENGAKALADDATRRTIGREFFAAHSIDDLRQQSEYWLNAQGRLAEPMVRHRGASHFTPVDWPQAWEMAAGVLRALPTPDHASFYTSGKATNESAFLFQLFARTFGTNNLPDCSNMCHESSGAGLVETIGIGKSTVTLEDLEHAGCILVTGQNPATNHPRMLTSLARAKERGASIIAINPIREVGLFNFTNPQHPWRWLGGEALASQFLQVRINGDVPLLKGLCKALLERDDADHAFIDGYTSGFEAFAADARATTWQDIVAASGVAQPAIVRAAETIARAEGVVFCWAMGLTQHKNAVDNIRGLVNLALLTGNIGKPHAGLLCVRGHSNVQGDRTMGIGHHMSEGFLSALDREFEIVSPRPRGYDVVETIRAMGDGRVRAFVSLGGNFLSATPDTPVVGAALDACALNASIVTKLNRSHLCDSEITLLLPCLGRSEHDRQASGLQMTTVENTVSVVSGSRGVFEPVSEKLKSEVSIVAGLAQATFGADASPRWRAMTDDYGAIRDAIARVVPGFSDFSARVADGKTFYLPIPPKDRQFPTDTGKAKFSVTPIRPVPVRPGEYLLMTVRTHDQFNTVVYGMDDRYRGVFNDRRVVFMHADDLAAAGWPAGQRVNLVSRFDGRERRVDGFSLVPLDIARGCLAAYFPETNPLVALDSTAEISNTPASKSVVVRLERA